MAYGVSNGYVIDDVT